MDPYNKEKPNISNVQYVKRILADERVEFDINGHIDNEYYETVAVIDQADLNEKKLTELLRDYLLQAREKTIQLKKLSQK